MWGRIYPHAALLILANIILEASCKGNGSLTFVIDDTASMSNDIAQVKRSVDHISNIVFNEKSSQISNMVLVTFNDPEATVNTVTTNRQTFKRTLNAVYTYNILNRDCWEPSMKGLRLALETSNRDSYIYVFTDAPAKDYGDSHYVKELCQKKQSQIVFVLTGHCNNRYGDAPFDVYFDIAHACSGQAFDVDHNQVHEVLRTIEETIKGNKTVFTSTIVPAGVEKHIPFTIDDHTDYAIVSVSGKDVYLDIKGPSFSLEKIMWNNNGKVAKLNNAKPGTYVATVKGQKRTSVVIVGRTDFFFKHGFSELQPKSPGDTSLQPIAKSNVHLSISVTDDHHSVRIVSAQILDMNENPIYGPMPLSETSKDFYITNSFAAPSQRFKVAVNGIVKATGKSIKRIGKIPITPQEPPIKLPNNKKPTVKITEGKTIEIEYNSTMKLTCNVDAFPEPKIMWANLKGHVMPSKMSIVELPYKYISYMDLSYASKGDRYKCYAANDFGRDERTINVVVKEPFTVKSTPSGITKLTYGKEGIFACDITSHLPIDIHWYHVNDLTGQTREILSSDKYEVSASRTQLKIKKMDLDLVGRYACRVSLKNKKDVQKSFLTRVQIDGLKNLKISGVDTKKVKIGSPASIECRVEGEPKPNITWQFMGKSSSRFVTIFGFNEVLNIPKVEIKDAGRYKCIAQNEIRMIDHITTLEVQDLPKIVSSNSTTYQSIEGDALLKIPCVAAGLPKPTITWKLNGRVIDPSGKYSIQDGALIIRDLKVSDTNSYTCEVKNEVGTVSVTFKTYIRQPPKLSGVTSKTVTMGNPTSIDCMIVKGEPKPNITWQFMDKSSSKFVPIAGSETTLRITNAETKHAGSYKCIAKNDVGNDEHITTLIVKYLPKITTSSSMIYQATDGDAFLKIPCIADGFPKPVIIWKLSGRNITPSAKYSMENGALIIRGPTVSDTNSYTCEAKNEVGAYSATFKTYIRQAPKVSGVATKKIKIGSPATIECKVEGEPKPTITWQFMDHSSSNFLPIPGSNKVLNIPRAEIKHAGRYKCVAQNIVGKNDHITTVEVQDLPRIISSNSTTYQSIEGDALLKIPCVAAGLPKPTITWKLNGRVIDPSGKYSIQDGALIIRDLKVSDTNSYTCEVKNEVGTVSVTFKTYIRQPPKLSGVTSKTVTMGNPTSIDCMIVKGEPKPNITWQFMDKSSSKFVPIAGSETTLRITNAETKHAGSYKCIAKNDVGNDEHITTLIVKYLPKITTSSSMIYQATDGDAFLKIPCIADGFPKPVIIWKLSGRNITPSAKYSIENGVLIIRGPTVSDTNSYTCEAKNEVGAYSATFKTYICQAPKVSGVATKKIKIGSPATIECKVEGEPKPTITWQFMDHSSSNFLPIPGSNKVLNIPRAEIKHAGRYKCVAQNIVGKNDHITTVEVQDLPRIISSNSTTYQSIEGDALLKIPCVAAGLPKPTITWKLNGRVIDPSGKYSIQDGALIIRDLKVSDTNSYTCEAKNEVGTVSVTFKTYIRQLPKLSGVASKNVRMGYPTSIECTIVKGEPKPKMSWQYMDKSISKFVPIAGSETTLHITKAEKKHAGSYKCVAQNSVGRDEHITTLIVEYAPGITTNSSTVEGIVGDLALRIPCNVVGVPKPAITWKLKGTTITPNAKYSMEDGALVIIKPTEKDTSSYTCEAKNNVSTVSVTFEAKVDKYPKTSGTVHYVYLKPGETRKLKCEEYNSTSQSIKWFITTKAPDLSATSSRPETTTSWSTGASTTLRTITQDAGNKEQIQIASATASDHDGNYTCHVSDKHGNTQTHTYVVDVGMAPKFLYDDNSSISNWRGDIKDITQNCEIDENTKPIPMVEWRFNGKVLTDLSLAGVGQYTCNVSNVHGSVLKRFDVKSSACLITRIVRDSPYMPLVLNDEGSWHKFETKDDTTIVEQEVKIILSCPSQKGASNTFKSFPKKSTLEAICYKEDAFLVDDKIYKLSDLQCTHSIEPSVVNKKAKCSTETSELLSVGYNVPAFLEAYEVCFDRKINMPLYTRILMTDTNNNGASGSNNWYTYPGIGSEKTEKGFTCKDATSSCCYRKSQLVNAIDFNDGPAKKSTFIDPLNVIPVWIPCDTSKSSWEAVNDMVRSQLPIYIDIVVWSGTHTFQEKNGAVIPRYLWKVVRLIDDEVMAIVHVNDPNPTKNDIKCKTPDVCEKYEDWFKRDDSTYCCSLPDFLKSFDIHGTDIGESMDAALDRIEEA